MSKSKKDLKFEIREIALGDLKNGYFPTLKNLSELGSIEGNMEKAEQIFRHYYFKSTSQDFCCDRQTDL